MVPFVSQPDFDFRVYASTRTVTVKAGQTVAVPIAVQAVKGDPRPIVLTASDWSRSAGLRANIIPSTVPSGGAATLHVTVPAGAPAGSYFYTVRGDAEGTFKTSNDTVTVVVAPDEEAGDGRGLREDRRPSSRQRPRLPWRLWRRS